MGPSQHMRCIKGKAKYVDNTMHFVLLYLITQKWLTKIYKYEKTHTNSEAKEGDIKHKSLASIA